MKVYSLKDLSEKIGAQYIGKDVEVKGVAFNSSMVKKGDLFVAIVAARDGHDFILAAIQNKAAAVLVSKKQAGINIPQIIVPDTRVALGQLAKIWLKQFDVSVVAITGSCGKTTTKEILASILSQKAKTVHTQGNFNNDLGVPVTIFKVNKDTKYVILEFGTNSFGEIPYLCKLVKIDVAIITNIAASHLEKLLSLDGVMKEKGALFDNLTDDSTAIINIDDKKIKAFSHHLKTHKISYSMINDNADIVLKQRCITKNGKSKLLVTIMHDDIEFKFSLLGKHNVQNAIAALSCAKVLGIPFDIMQQGITEITSTKGRFNVQVINNIQLIDDSYNASVPSVLAAIETLASFNGQKIFVMSNMGELGEKSKFYHQKMGKWCFENKLDHILLFGDENLLKFTVEASQGTAILYATKHLLIESLLEILNYTQETMLIIKGSRANQMEEILRTIKKNLQ